MSARRDKKRGRWLVEFRYRHPDGTTTRIAKDSPVQTRRGSQEYERQLRQALLDGTYGNPQRVQCLEEYAEAFLAAYARTNNKLSEYESKKQILKQHIVPELGGYRLSEITAREIEQYKAKKHEALSAKTINNHLTIIRTMLAEAKEHGDIKEVPRIKWMKTQRPQVDFLTFDDAAALLSSADGEWQTMIALGTKAGLRQGEILGLDRRHIDLARGVVVVAQGYVRGEITTTKSSKIREVPINATLEPLLLEQLASHDHESLFVDKKGRRRLKGQCKWPLWRACEAAGIRRIGWHVLRHTFASHLVMRAVPLVTVKELMGHSSIEMTMRYAHLTPDVRREAVAKI